MISLNNYMYGKCTCMNFLSIFYCFSCKLNNYTNFGNVVRDIIFIGLLLLFISGVGGFERGCRIHQRLVDNEILSRNKQGLRPYKTHMNQFFFYDILVILRYNNVNIIISRKFHKPNIVQYSACQFHIKDIKWYWWWKYVCERNGRGFANV